MSTIVGNTIQYSIATETLNGVVASDKLKAQLRAASFSVSFRSIHTGIPTSDSLVVVFTAVPIAGDKTTADAIVAAHDGVPLPVEKREILGGSLLQRGGTEESPYVPKLVSSTPLLNAFWVKVIGTYAFTLNTGVDGLQILEVSDTANPKVISTLPFGLSLKDGDVAGRYLYAIDSDLNDETFFVVDVSNVAVPFVRGTLALGQNPTSVTGSGNLAYVTEETSGLLKIIDTTDPDNPFLLNSIAVPGGFPQVTRVSEGFAYVTTANVPDFVVIDVTNPLSLSVRGSLTLGSFVPSLDVSAKHVFLVDQSLTPSGVRVIDVVDPDTPVAIGIASMEVASNALAVKASGDYLYATDEALFDLWVFDIANRADPKEVGRFPFGVPSSPKGIDLVGNEVYVADGFSDTLKIIDISGLHVQSAVIHALKAFTAQILEDLRVGKDLLVRNGLNVGGQALFDGDVGIGGKLTVLKGGLPLAPGYVEGLATSRPSVTTVQIGEGICRDDTDAFNLVVASPLIADITLTGPAGRNVETAEVADKWYAEFLIGDTKRVNTSKLFLVNQDDLLTFAMPTGYDVKLFRQWIRNDASSNLKPITELGNGRVRVVRYNQVTRAELLVFTNQEPTAFASADVSEFVPPTSLLGEFYFEFDAGGDDYFELRPTGSGLANNTGRRLESGVSSGIKADTLIYEVDSNQTFDYRKSDLTGAGLTLYVYGYRIYT